MNAESTLLIEIWDAVRDHLPAARRAEAARLIVVALADYGLDAGDLRDTLGEDELLTDAIGEVFGEDEDEEHDDDEVED